MIDRKVKLHDIDVGEFIRVVEECEGNVYLETKEGDCLNLKSRLCVIVGLAQLIHGGMIAEATIRCENPADERKLYRFGLFREIPDTEK